MNQENIDTIDNGIKVQLNEKYDYMQLIGGIGCLLSGIWFWFTETKYFGWNQQPSCQFEGHCDTVALVLISAAIWIIIGSKKSSITVVINHKN